MGQLIYQVELNSNSSKCCYSSFSWFVELLTVAEVMCYRFIFVAPFTHWGDHFVDSKQELVQQCSLRSQLCKECFISCWLFSHKCKGGLSTFRSPGNYLPPIRVHWLRCIVFVVFFNWRYSFFAAKRSAVRFSMRGVSSNVRPLISFIPLRAGTYCHLQQSW